MSEELEYQEEQKRPAFLTVLVVLSFISIGISLISGIFGLISGKQSDEVMLVQSVQMAEARSELRKAGLESWTGIYDQIEAMGQQANDSFYLAAFLGMIVSLIGFYGVFMMMKGKKIGFHVYIIYSLLSMGIIYVYISPANVPTILTIVSAIFSGLFIFLYSRNLHWMNK